MKTLIIDDSKAMVQIITQLLSKFGLDNIEQMSDPSMTVWSSKANEFDLIFVDWHLPAPGSEEIIRRIRAANPKACIIVIANQSRKESVLLAARAGANHYIVRPISESILSSKIQAAIISHEPESEDIEPPTV